MAEVKALCSHSLALVHDYHGALLMNILPMLMLLLMVIMLMQVDTLCDRLAILVAGRVNAEGSPDQLKQQFGGGYKVSTKLLIVDR